MVEFAWRYSLYICLEMMIQGVVKKRIPCLAFGGDALSLFTRGRVKAKHGGI